MRKEIVEKTYYTFDELDETAKEKARAWYREGELDYGWWDNVYEDAKTIADLFGLSITDIHFELDRAAYVSFAGVYEYAKGGAAKVREYAPKDSELHAIVDRLKMLQRRAQWQASASIRETQTGINVYTYDADEDELTDIFRSFAEWIRGRLKAEYDHLMSNESVDEMIRANGYEFGGEGRIA